MLELFVLKGVERNELVKLSPEAEANSMGEALFSVEGSLKVYEPDEFNVVSCNDLSIIEWL